MWEWIHDVKKVQDIGMGTRYGHGYEIYQWAQEVEMSTGK